MRTISISTFKRIHHPCISLFRQWLYKAIQMLIENAIKHNEISNRKPLLISIHATDDQVIVSNHLQPRLTNDCSTQIGLDNLSKRYQLLFKRDIEVKAEDDFFTIKLPLI